MNVIIWVLIDNIYELNKYFKIVLFKNNDVFLMEVYILSGFKPSISYWRKTLNVLSVTRRFSLLLPQMALHRLFQLSSVLRSAVSLTLRRNIGISAVLLQRAKELDPVQKLFLDKIRDYNNKSKSVDRHTRQQLQHSLRG